MPVPLVSLLPDPPLPTDPEQVFDNKVGASLLAQQAMVPEMNTQAGFTNQRAIDADASAQAAAASATTATSKAGEASQSADAAQTYAANLEALDELWLGAATSDPATGKAGAPLVAGNAYVNSATGYLRAFNGTEWVQGVSDVAGVISVNGQSGVVTGIATTAGVETLTNKTVSGPRSSMAQYIDKTVTNAAATGTVTLDLSAADVFDLTLTGNTTLALSNAPTLSGETFSIVVRVRQGATAYSLAWFAGVTWLASSTPPTPAANKIVEYILSTSNGTGWLGRKGAAN